MLKHRNAGSGLWGRWRRTADSRLRGHGGVGGEMFGVFAQEVQGGSVYVSVC